MTILGVIVLVYGVWLVLGDKAEAARLLTPNRYAQAANDVRAMMEQAKAASGPAFVASFSNAPWHESRHVFLRPCIRCHELYSPPMDGPDTHRCTHKPTVH